MYVNPLVQVASCTTNVQMIKDNDPPINHILENFYAFCDNDKFSKLDEQEQTVEAVFNNVLL